MNHSEHCDLLAGEVARFADLIDPGGQRLEVPVPACPGWSLGQLAAHLGTVHRWAEHLVRARAGERISPATMGLGPAEPSARWLRDGGDALLVTLRAADPEAEMWAWGADQHVRFWSRRQCHETLVHRMDAELALGVVPGADGVVAADAVDEFLVNLGLAAFSPRVANLRGRGARLAFRAIDEDREWSVTLGPDGFQLGAEADGAGAHQADAGLAGPAVSLLLVLYGRLTPGAAGVEATGDQAVIDLWLANSALE